jgi:hypothetical protein
VPVAVAARVVPPYVKVPARVVVPVTDRLVATKLGTFAPLVEIVPATFRLPPTYALLAMPTPPAVMIEPVMVEVESVARLELMPKANGIRAVVVVWPSLVIAVVRPFARSVVKALNTLEEMTVPVTTGWPVELMLNVPDPL